MGWDDFSKPVDKSAASGMVKGKAEDKYTGSGPNLFGNNGSKAPKLNSSARKRLYQVFGPNLDGKFPGNKKKSKKV